MSTGTGHASITLDVEVGSDPIAGDLAREGMERRSFSGLANRAAAIEAVRRPSEDEVPDQSANSGGGSGRRKAGG